MLPLSREKSLVSMMELIFILAMEEKLKSEEHPWLLHW
jgi:hypothetical protein